MAYVMTQKYVESQPLYRQEQQQLPQLANPKDPAALDKFLP